MPAGQLLPYKITNQTLKNIANIEYERAVIDSATVLQNLETRLELEAKAKIITFSLKKEAVNVNLEQVKKLLTKLPNTTPKFAQNYVHALNKIDELALEKEFDEEELKNFYEIFFDTKTYRQQDFPPPYVKRDELLAEIVKLIDWTKSLAANDTHPLVAACLCKAKLELIKPFDNFNKVIGDIVFNLYLKSTGFYGKSIKTVYCFEEFQYNLATEYTTKLVTCAQTNDFTPWLDFMTDGINHELSKVAELVRTMAKDTRLAKVAGRTRLTARQERIITYLQDFDHIRNEDFAVLFPDLSEDTILRELKKLVDLGLIVKAGKTKSSRYELG